MLVFVVPFNANYIEQPFIKAFRSMRAILARHDVELVMIDCRFGDKEHLSKKIRSIVDWVDGIIFPGNPYSIDPRIYREAPLHPERIDPEPKNFEFVKSLIGIAEGKGTPILGICAGSWYLNVVRGGTLHQDVTHFTQEEKHDADPRDGRVVHEVKVMPRTMLSSLFKSERIKVNSWHDQSIGKLGHGLRPAAISSDGVIEAIEGEEMDEADDMFFVGIQFHPEYLLRGDAADGYLPPADIAKQQNIFKRMVEIANKRALTIPADRKTEEIKERAVAFHRAHTESLLLKVDHRGKFKIR